MFAAMSKAAAGGGPRDRLPAYAAGPKLNEKGGEGMKEIQFAAALLAAIFISPIFVSAGAEAAPQSFAIPVTLDPSIEGVRSGRIIVFAEKVEPGADATDKVDFSIFAPERVSVAAREVEALAPGAAALVGTGVDAFPQSFADLAPGEYRFQAVLDRNHNYNYAGRSGGDIVSGVVAATLPGGVPALMLKDIVPGHTMETVLASMPEERAAVLEQNLENVRPIDFVSPALSKFWGRPIHIKGFAALPPNYKKDDARYPAVYATRGFGALSIAVQKGAATIAGLMASGEAPPMIWFYLDQSIATGAHEFTDSVNNGPWGEALTEELIPYLQKEFAADPRAGSRFLTGHSSGGWTSLWLQVRYPALFGGAWPTSPDPADFHAFTNIDLYAPNANAYRDEKGEPRPLVRDKGKVYVTIEQYVKLEEVLGPYGGQFASFDWVFSPKADDGRPQKAIDRVSGAVTRMSPPIGASITTLLISSSATGRS